jgi:DNA-3-methyladenine glycosylase II
LVTVNPPPDLVANLTRCICSQQLSTKAAETIHGRLVDRFGDGVHADVQAIHAAPLEELRAVGLSWAKAGYLKDLSAKAIANELPDMEKLATMTEDEIISCLTRVKGLGQWSVEMLLMFRLGRLDVWPVDDLGIREGWTRLMDLETRVTPKVLKQEGERFRPFRSVAAWYLWRVLEG